MKSKITALLALVAIFVVSLNASSAPLSGHYRGGNAGFLPENAGNLGRPARAFVTACEVLIKERSLLSFSPSLQFEVRSSYEELPASVPADTPYQVTSIAVNKRELLELLAKTGTYSVNKTSKGFISKKEYSLRVTAMTGKTGRQIWEIEVQNVTSDIFISSQSGTCQILINNPGQQTDYDFSNPMAAPVPY